MPDNSVEPVVVPTSAISQQVKGQLRIFLALIAGALLSKLGLPTSLLNDQVLTVLTGIAFLGIASAWSWLSHRLKFLQMFAIASDPRVPDSVAQVEKK